jgi:PAS domain-containing protein
MNKSDTIANFTEETIEFTGQTIDLTSWFTADLSSSGSFDLGIMAAESFGKLLDVLAIPALLIDWSYTVVFANQSCGRLAANFKSAEGLPFSSLVPRSANAEKAKTLIRKVFRSRRPQVADGILELDARKIWGRLYFRSVRIGPERFVLLLIEDMTNEKTRLLLSQRQLQQTETAVSQADERFRQEMNEHSKTREALRTQKRRFQALSELVPGCTAIIKNDGSIRQANTKFRELFEIDGDGDLAKGLNEVLEWLQGLDHPHKEHLEPRAFSVESGDGTRKEIRCSASRVSTSKECMVFCEYLE